MRRPFRRRSAAHGGVPSRCVGTIMHDGFALAAGARLQPTDDRVRDLARGRFVPVGACRVEHLGRDRTGMGEPLLGSATGGDALGAVVDMQVCVHGHCIGANQGALDQHTTIPHGTRPGMPGQKSSLKAGTLRLRGKGVAVATFLKRWYALTAGRCNQRPDECADNRALWPARTMDQTKMAVSELNPRTNGAIPASTMISARMHAAMSAPRGAAAVTVEPTSASSAGCSM